MSGRRELIGPEHEAGILGCGRWGSSLESFRREVEGNVGWGSNELGEIVVTIWHVDSLAGQNAARGVGDWSDEHPGVRQEEPW